MERLDFHSALNNVMAIVSRTNKYIDETMPWTLAKEEESRAQLASVMYHLADSLRIVAHLLRPIMPNSPAQIFEQLGMPSEIDRFVVKPCTKTSA